MIIIYVYFWWCFYFTYCPREYVCINHQGILTTDTGVAFHAGKQETLGDRGSGETEQVEVGLNKGREAGLYPCWCDLPQVT